MSRSSASPAKSLGNPRAKRAVPKGANTNCNKKFGYRILNTEMELVYFVPNNNVKMGSASRIPGDKATAIMPPKKTDFFRTVGNSSVSASRANFG